MGDCYCQIIASLTLCVSRVSALLTGCGKVRVCMHILYMPSLPYIVHALLTIYCTYPPYHILYIPSLPYTVHTLLTIYCTYPPYHILYIPSLPYIVHTLLTIYCTYHPYHILYIPSLPYIVYMYKPLPPWKLFFCIFVVSVYFQHHVHVHVGVLHVHVFYFLKCKAFTVTRLNSSHFL